MFVQEIALGSSGAQRPQAGEEAFADDAHTGGNSFEKATLGHSKLKREEFHRAASPANSCCEVAPSHWDSRSNPVGVKNGRKKPSRSYNIANPN